MANVNDAPTPTETSIVLGIDPGLGITGWAVVASRGDAQRLVDSGTIRTNAKTEPSRRLLTICEQVRELVAEYEPTAVAVEDVFLAKDARAAFALGQARGAAMVGAALAGTPVYSYTALQVKKSVTGNGRAAKEQVGYMVCHMLSLSEPLQPADCSDAAAIALCHCAKRGHDTGVAAAATTPAARG
jgi:crossover junction endodeoxyribonuclease RuvC